MRDIMKFLQQAQEMQGRVQKIQEDLQQMTITATSGGGMVTAEVNGQGVLKRIKVDPSIVDPKDVEMLEDMITVAVADAQRKAQQQAQEQLGQLSGGLELPFKLPL